MTTTIQIAHDVSDATIAKIEANLATQVLRNSNWNGVNFRVERDDYTCIPDNDSDEAVALLHEISAIIMGVSHETKR